ncbi:MAG: HAD-IA family hydrolase [Candidatus Binataceae bacterium]
MLKVVFFDAAGTLFEPREPVGDTYARIARDFGVRASGAEVNATFRRIFHGAPGLAFGPGHSAVELRRLERQWWRGIVWRVFAEIGRFDDFDAYFNTLFAYFADPRHWLADPQAMPLLSGLKAQGLQLGMVSNFDWRLYAILDGLGLLTYFDSITISSEAGWAKPSAEIFRVALAKHAAIAAEALHIGDSLPLDIGGAQAAGIAAILLARDNHGETGAGAEIARVNSLAAIVPMMQKMAFP